MAHSTSRVDSPVCGVGDGGVAGPGVGLLEEAGEAEDDVVGVAAALYLEADGESF
jgi:hypothetical protein